MKTNENMTLDYDTDRDAPIRDLADREVDTASGGVSPEVFGMFLGALIRKWVHDSSS